MLRFLDRLLTLFVLGLTDGLLALLPERAFPGLRVRLAELWLDLLGVPIPMGGQTDSSFGMVRTFDDFTGKALDATNFYTTNSDTGGTAFVVNAQRNGVVRGGTDGTDGDITNLFKDPAIYRPNSGGPLVFEARVALITSIADGESFIGLSDAATDETPIQVSTTDAQTDAATDAVGFCYTGAGTADWKRAGVANGVSGTPARCNIKGATTPVAATFQTFKILMNELADADFYINGTWQGRINVASTATVSLLPAFSIEGGGAARSMDIDYVYVQSGRI